MNNRLFLMLLLTVSCGHVMAEWVKVSSNATTVFYVDSSALKKVGANVMVWVLRDHAGIQHGGSEPFLSSRDQIEVDCGQRRIRRIYSSDHPQHMGEGKPVRTEHGPMSWNPASSSPVFKRIVAIACMQP
ncbi:MAG: hypothetical protein Q7U13_06350 [Rhodoferax sp.]|nr:hypothetical protein [Rhodoferax sp.]